MYKYTGDFYVLQSLSTYNRESSLSSLRGLGTTDNTPLTSAAASSPNTSITGPLQVRREGGRSGGVEGELGGEREGERGGGEREREGGRKEGRS